MTRPIPLGFCQCGCGNRTRIATQTKRAKGHVRGQPVRFLSGHHQRVLSPSRERNGNWKGGRFIADGYVRILLPEHPRANREGYVAEHIVVAEKALGRPIPVRHEVHHVNEDRADNRGANLVICEDTAYHALLHVRMRALRACGNANWLHCSYCGRHDDPAKLTLTTKTASGTSQYHRACAAAYQRRRRNTRHRRGA